MREPTLAENQEFVSCLLIQYMKGSSPILNNNQLSNVLHKSIILGDINSVQKLLFINKDIPQLQHARFVPIGSHSDTFLHTAVQNLYPEIVELLLNFHNNTDPESKNHYLLKALDLAKNLKSDITNKGES